MWGSSCTTLKQLVGLNMMTEVKHKMYTLEEIEKAAELWYGKLLTFDDECLAENRLNNGEEYPSSVVKEEGQNDD